MTHVIYISAVFGGLAVALFSIVKGLRWYLRWEHDQWELNVDPVDRRRREVARKAESLLGSTRLDASEGGAPAGPSALSSRGRSTSAWYGAGPAAAGVEGVRRGAAPARRGSFARIRLVLDDGAGHARSVERRLCLN